MKTYDINSIQNLTVGEKDNVCGGISNIAYLGATLGIMAGCVFQPIGLPLAIFCMAVINNKNKGK